jgi:hypothetical protein
MTTLRLQKSLEHTEHVFLLAAELLAKHLTDTHKHVCCARDLKEEHLL